MTQQPAQRLQWQEDGQGRWFADVIACGCLVMLLRVSYPHPDGHVHAFVGRGAKLSEQCEREQFMDVDAAKAWVEAEALRILEEAVTTLKGGE